MLVIVFTGIYYADAGNLSDYFVESIVEGDSVEKHYAGKEMKFIAYDDGVFAFTSHQHVLCGNKLVLDKDAYQRIVHKDIPFLSVALDRGYNRVILSSSYIGRNLEPEFSNKVEGDRLDKKTLSNFGLFSIDYASYIAESPLLVYIDFLDKDKKVIVLRLEPSKNKDSE